MNLSLFFFPNFFFYVFLSRYSLNYFNSNVQALLTQTLLLGLFIILFSFGATYILKKILKPKKDLLNGDITQIAYEAKYTCSNCGTEFKSLPKYCYNCLHLITKEDTTNE